jgi:3-polyprenyl-4-hydroxybenzoate decarboxylase
MAPKKGLKILLGLTGSVATILYKKIILAIKDKGYDVDVILTKSALSFIDPMEAEAFAGANSVRFFFDEDEWKFPQQAWKKGDRILHIEMRDTYSALVVAPCSANTLAKVANGFADNLLTSVIRAWDPIKPLIIAPAMNTQMWESPITNKHLSSFRSLSDNNSIVQPQHKMLACGTEGYGALADVGEIADMLEKVLRWWWPLAHWEHQLRTIEAAIPVEPHPGAFAAHRNGHTHTGVDLYTNETNTVHAVEDGVIVGIEHFTGPQDNSPWWKDTDCVLVRGASGVVLYGEIMPFHFRPGNKVTRGRALGTVLRVIKEGHEHPEITGWQPSMLHMELYPWNATKASNGFDKDLLRDPTPLLLDAASTLPKVTKLTWKP